MIKNKIQRQGKEPSSQGWTRQTNRERVPGAGKRLRDIPTPAVRNIIRAPIEQTEHSSRKPGADA